MSRTIYVYYRVPRFLGWYRIAELRDYVFRMVFELCSR